MNGQLKIGTKFTSKYGRKYSITELLGSGGQGEVYEVAEGNKKYALKWYFKNSATSEQKAILHNLIEKGKPSDTFLWPEDFVQNEKSFGYIMPLRPPEYKSVTLWLNRRVNTSFKNLLFACHNLTQGFQTLHQAGYAYRDISAGNVFFNPNNGDVLISDNDNVTVSGSNTNSILGTIDFMAPEIVRGEAKPSRDTDRYSLAVLLFYMMMLNHPLEGEAESKIKCKDIYARRQLYGYNPVFIFDPQNKSNRPVKGIHTSVFNFAPLYPKYIKDLFARVFTEGLNDTAKRVTEFEWLEAIDSMIGGIVYCSCGVENFYDPNLEVEKKELICWSCGNKVKIPIKLVVGKRKIPLLSKRKIFSEYLYGDGNMKDIVAELSQNPQNPNIWGLRNLSNRSWTYTKPGAAPVQVENGRVCMIMRDATIDFGQSKGCFE